MGLLLLKADIFLVVVISLLCVGRPVQGIVRLNDLFDFGPNTNDLELEQTEGASAEVMLWSPIPFLGANRSSITVLEDGVLQLRVDSSSNESADILVFSADADISGIGRVFYRETQDPDMLQLASTITTTAAFPQLSLSFTNLFIVTWFYVGYFDGNTDLTNTFQCAIATDGSTTIVAQLYPEDLIQWTTGDGDGGSGGLGGSPAEVGFVSGNFSSFLALSGDPAVVDVEEVANTVMRGLFVFRVEALDAVEEPDQCEIGIDNCDANAQCMNMPDGFLCMCLTGFSGDGVTCVETGDAGSATLSGSGAPPQGSASGTEPPIVEPLSCVTAGFTTCCDPANNTTGGCVVSDATSSCSCSQLCFSTNNCCTDIADVPCFPDINVTIAESKYDVVEDGGLVTIDVIVSGTFPTPELQASLTTPVIGFIVLYTFDGTATEPSDYADTIAVVEFESSGVISVNVSIVDDGIHEDREFFTANITTTDDFITLGLTSTEVCIDDDDVVEVSLEVASASVSESNGSVEVCVAVVSGQLSRDVELNLFTQSGTATSGMDFASFNETVTISAAVFPQRTCVDIQVFEDNTVETLEGFTVVLGPPMDDRVLLNVSILAIDIVDTSVVTVGFEQLTYSVAEGENDTAVCVVIVDGAIETSIHIFLHFMNGSAVFGFDVLTPAVYVSIYFFPANQSDSRCVPFQTVQDGVVGAQETFTVALDAGNNTQVVLSPANASVFIEESDFVAVTLEDQQISAIEGEVVEVCVQITGALDRNLTVLLTTGTGSATPVQDYTPFFTNLPVTFTTSPDRMCVEISIIDDNAAEPDEPFPVLLTSDDPAAQLGPITTTTILISDAVEDCLIGFILSSFTVQEDSDGVFVCVRLAGSTSGPVTLTVETVSGTATAGDDFVALSEVITFQPTQGSRFICPMVAIIDDLLSEPTEFFEVQLTPDAIGGCGLQTQTISATILDLPADGGAGIVVVFEQQLYSVPEENQVVTVCVVASQPFQSTESVTITTTPLSASAGADYDPGPFSITFLPSDTRGCVDIGVEDDTLDEDDEQFSLTLASNNPLAVAVSPSGNSAVVTIEDNDPVVQPPELVQLEFEQEVYSVSESLSQVVACLSPVNPQDLVAPISANAFTASSDATPNMDFTSVVTVLTFSPGDSRQCVTVPILNDSDPEGNEVFVIVVLRTTTTGSSVASASVIIVDDDGGVGLDFEFEQDLYTVPESGTIPPNQDNVQLICVELNNPSDVVEATLLTSPISATDSVDYVSISVPLTFSPLGARQCVPLRVLNDDIDEDNEMLVVTLQQGTVVLAMTSVEIIDDDNAVFDFVQDQVEVTEGPGEIASVCVASDRPLGRNGLTVLLSTTPNTAQTVQDFTGVTSFPLVFNAGDDVICLAVSITNDLTSEPTETFFVGIDGTSSTATVTILDDDDVVVPVSFGFEQDVYGVTEGVDIAVTVCVVVQGTVTTTTTVLVSTMADSAGLSDFVGVTNSPLTFLPADTRRCLSIGIADDTLVEGPESFLVNLLGQSNSFRPSTSVVIQDNEVVAPVSFGFEQDVYGVTEGVDTAVTVCVVVQGMVTTTTTVFVSTMADSAGLSDFVGVTNSPLTFLPADTRRCLSIGIADDTLVEGPESFLVNLLGQSNSFRPSTSVVIQDNEVVATVSFGFEQDVYGVTEGVDTAVTVCVVVQGMVTTTTTVFVSTMADSAGLSDFVGVTNSPLTFLPADTRRCLSIGIADDTLVEGPESFLVNLLGQSNSFRPSTSVIIQDNEVVDLPSFDFEQVQYFVTEGFDSTVTVCVVTSGPTLTVSATVFLTTAAFTATDGSDYLGVSSTPLNFAAGVPRMCLNIVILNDGVEEGTESFTVSLAGQSSNLATTTVSILDDDDEDFPVPPGTVIVVINDTPTVSLEAGGTTASIFIEFTLSNLAASATCEIFGETPFDCSQGSFLFTGQLAFEQTPVRIIVTARNVFGVVIASVSRNVRLGFNQDCAVNFINAAQGQVLVFEDSVFIEWEEIGPIGFTECRLDRTVFIRCSSPLLIDNLAPGSHEVKVRPNGEACRREIRRTVTFTIV